MTADRSRVTGSAPGKFYVSKRCIGCTLCRETAPGHFRTNEEEGADFVYRQPATPEEEAICRKARETCPADAIREDGAAS
jgi:ferredoxin